MMSNTPRVFVGATTLLVTGMTSDGALQIGGADGLAESLWWCGAGELGEQAAASGPGVTRDRGDAIAGSSRNRGGCARALGGT